MIPFVILLLCATSALGADKDQNEQRSGSRDSHTIIPIDYFEDIFNRDLNIKPDSKFSNNFEQTRRDQTPQQVEIKEEDVGRHLHLRPTITTPVSIFSMNVESEAQHVYPNMSPRNDLHRNGNNRNYNNKNDRNTQSWNESQKSSVPPPSRFAFSRPHSQTPREIESSQNQHQPMTVAPSQNGYRHASRHFKRRPSQMQSTAQTAMQGTETVPTQAPHVPQYVKESEISFAPSASYVSDSINENKQTIHRNMPPRGHHKFSWNDLKTDNEKVAPLGNHHVSLPQEPTTVPPSTVHAMNDNTSPPPVPTLSPWYDGFGK